MMLELGLDGMKGAECGLYGVQALGLFVLVSVSLKVR